MGGEVPAAPAVEEGNPLHHTPMSKRLLNYCSFHGSFRVLRLTQRVARRVGVPFPKPPRHECVVCQHVSNSFLVLKVGVTVGESDADCDTCCKD